LTVVGNSLFWIENASSGHGLDASMSVIRTMPITGGTPTTVLSQPHLDGNLASDGSRLYFSYTVTSPNSVIASCGLDGGNMTTLGSGVQTNLGEEATGETSMRVVNGTLYFAA